MTNQVKLHVGYIGITEEGDRVKIVGETKNPNYPFEGDNGETYTKGGWYYLDTPNSRLNIIGPWTDDATEYETGVWYGWNGGDCPVHPDAEIEVRLCDPSEEYGVMIDFARCWDWVYRGGAGIVSFRIVTPYIEHKKPREVLIDARGTTNWCFTNKHNPNAVLFREVIEVDDK